MKAHLATCEDCRATELLLQRDRLLAPGPAPLRAVARDCAAGSWPRWRPSPPRPGRAGGSWLRPGRLVPSGVALAAAVAVAAVIAHHRVEQRHSLDLAVAANYELLSDYEVVGLSADDLDVVEHLDELEGRP